MLNYFKGEKKDETMPELITTMIRRAGKLVIAHPESFPSLSNNHNILDPPLAIQSLFLYNCFFMNHSFDFCGDN